MSFAAFPELEEVFEDFKFALVHKGYFTPKIVKAKGPLWKKLQTVMAWTYEVEKMRLSNSFMDWKKLRGG